MENQERLKSLTYLKEVSPLGGALTPEQSKAYRKLLIEEGVVSLSTGDLLVELVRILEKNPVAFAKLRVAIDRVC